MVSSIDLGPSTSSSCLHWQAAIIATRVFQIAFVMMVIMQQASKQTTKLRVYMHCCHRGFVGLRKAQKSALLSKLHLVLTKICPVSELRGFIFGCLGVTVGWADALQFHEDVQEQMEVFLCLEGERTFPLFGYVEQCTRNRANFHSLAKC